MCGGRGAPEGQQRPWGAALRPQALCRSSCRQTDRQTDRRLPGLQRVGSNRCKWESAAELPVAEITLSCEPQLLHFLADSLQVNCEGLMALLTGFCGEGRGREEKGREDKASSSQTLQHGWLVIMRSHLNTSCQS